MTELELFISFSGLQTMDIFLV